MFRMVAKLARMTVLVLLPPVPRHRCRQQRAKTTVNLARKCQSLLIAPKFWRQLTWKHFNYYYYTKISENDACTQQTRAHFHRASLNRVHFSKMRNNQNIIGTHITVEYASCNACKFHMKPFRLGCSSEGTGNRRLRRKRWTMKNVDRTNVR